MNAFLSKTDVRKPKGVKNPKAFLVNLLFCRTRFNIIGKPCVMSLAALFSVSIRVVHLHSRLLPVTGQVSDPWSWEMLTQMFVAIVLWRKKWPESYIFEECDSDEGNWNSQNKIQKKAVYRGGVHRLDIESTLFDFCIELISKLLSRRHSLRVKEQTHGDSCAAQTLPVLCSWSIRGCGWASLSALIAKRSEGNSS